MRLNGYVSEKGVCANVHQTLSESHLTIHPSDHFYLVLVFCGSCRYFLLLPQMESSLLQCTTLNELHMEIIVNANLLAILNTEDMFFQSAYT